MQQTFIDNRYRIVKPLGSGGMAEVYLAHDEVLDRDVALKILRDQYADDEDFVERFKREAQSAASLSHPNIVSVYDRGETEDGTYYMAMEYVPGGTLKERIHREGALPPHAAASIALQVAEALQVAHQQGLIHRDVKPQNILLTESGDAKVADFGIARAASSSMVTRTGLILGTAHYISPEQAMGKPVGPPSDLYSLGVVLYEMLTGEVPYDSETPIAVAMKHVNGQLRPPKEINPDIPEGMNALTARLLAGDPAERYSDAAELIDDLKQVSEGHLSEPATTGVLNRAAVRPGPGGQTQRTKLWGASPAAPTLPGYPVGAGGVHDGEKQRRREAFRRIAAAAPLAAVALLGILGWALMQNLQSQNDTLSVPDLRGKTLDEAKQTVGSDFELVISSTEDSEQPKDTILSQAPEPEEEALKGTEISVVTSSGQRKVAVPDVSGQSVGQASQTLTNVGLGVAGVQTSQSSQLAGTVVSTDPPTGSEVDPGTLVTLLTSSGPTKPGDAKGKKLKKQQEELQEQLEEQQEELEEQLEEQWED